MSPVRCAFLSLPTSYCAVWFTCLSGCLFLWVDVLSWMHVQSTTLLAWIWECAANVLHSVRQALCGLMHMCRATSGASSATVAFLYCSKANAPLSLCRTLFQSLLQNRLYFIFVLCEVHSVGIINQCLTHGSLQESSMSLNGTCFCRTAYDVPAPPFAIYASVH